MSAGSILFVDEDYELRESFSRWFEQKGYETDLTYHPLQRLMLAAERQYDVVVIDIGLESMNGIEVLGEFVQRQFPVVVFTESKCPIFVSRALEGGAVDYLVKPSTMEDLESAIASAISKNAN